MKKIKNEDYKISTDKKTNADFGLKNPALQRNIAMQDFRF